MDIHTACWEGNLDIVIALHNEALRSHPPNNNSSSTSVYLSSTVVSGSRSTIKSPAYALATLIDTTPDGHKNTPLHYAAYNGHTAVVEYLVNVIHVPIDPLNEHHTTPLFFACQQNKSTTVQFLLQHGADPCIQETKMNYCPADVTDNSQILEIMVGSARRRGILYGRPGRLPRCNFPQFLNNHHNNQRNNYGTKPYITSSLMDQNIHKYVYIHDSPLAVRVQWDPTDGRKVRQLKDLLLFYSPENSLATSKKGQPTHKELLVKPFLTQKDTNNSKEIDTSLLAYSNGDDTNNSLSTSDTNHDKSKTTKKEDHENDHSYEKDREKNDDNTSDSDTTESDTESSALNPTNDKGVPSLALIPVPLSHIDIGVIDVTNAPESSKIVLRTRIPYSKAVGTNHTWSLDGLPRGTGKTYVVKVRAVNAFGPGKWSLPSQPLIMESFSPRKYIYHHPNASSSSSNPNNGTHIPSVEASIAWALEAATFPQHAKRMTPPVPPKSIAKEFRTDHIPPWVFEPRQTLNSSLRSLALTNAKYAGYKGMSINAPAVPTENDDSSSAFPATLAPGEVPLPLVPLEISNSMKCNKNRDIKRSKPYKIYEKPPSIGHGLPVSSPVAFEESNSMKNKGNPYGYYAGPHVEYGEATQGPIVMENEDEDKSKTKKTNKNTKKLLSSSRAYYNYAMTDPETTTAAVAPASSEKPKVWFTFDEYVEAATEEANEAEAERIKHEYEEEQANLRRQEEANLAAQKNEPEVYTRKGTGVGQNRSAIPPVEPLREYSPRKPIYIEGEEPFEESPDTEEKVIVPSSPAPETFNNMSPLTKRIGIRRTVIDSGTTGIGNLLAAAVQNKEALATAAMVTKFLPAYNPEINLDQASANAREAFDAAVQAAGSPRLTSPTKKERQRTVASLNGQITLGGIAGALKNDSSSTGNDGNDKVLTTRTNNHPGLFSRVTRPLITSTSLREEAANQRVQQVLSKIDDDQRKATLRRNGGLMDEDNTETTYPRDSVVDKLLAAYSSANAQPSTTSSSSSHGKSTKKYVKMTNTAFTPAAGKMDSKVKALLPKGPTAYAYMHGLVPSTQSSRGSTNLAFTNPVSDQEQRNKVLAITSSVNRGGSGSAAI